MKRAFIILSVITLIGFALYTYLNNGRRGRKVEEYFGIWHSNETGVDLTIKRASNNLVLLDYISINRKERITAFCSYENGCFYVGKTKTPIACEIDSFRIALDGWTYGFVGAK